MSTKIAINGTGRIGLIAIKIIASRSDMELVAINTTTDLDMLIYLLKYDSVHLGIDAEAIDEDNILINGCKVRVFSDRDPKNIDFGSCGAQTVLECTGKFLTTQSCEAHLRNGVKNVVMSAPAKDNTPTFVYNINTDEYKGEKIISNASCTTNALAPICKVLDQKFGIENGLMTTIHSYTNDQNILDVKHNKDKRRARAAAINMIPTTTGAAKAIGKVMPNLQGKLNGYAMRVPTVDVSIVDLTVNLKDSVTKEDINHAMQDASEYDFHDLIEVDNDKRVSSDFIGSEYSSIFVPDMTSVVDEKTVKVLAWYDNEWGYTSRLIDMAQFVSKYIKN